MKQGEKQLIVQVEKLKKNNAELLAGKQHLELENKHLELKVKQLLHRLYGKKSEAMDPAQLQLLLEGLVSDEELAEDNEADEEPPPAPKPKPKSRKKRGLPEGLRTEEKVIDVPESEKSCASTGLPKTHIRDEVTTELDYIPAEFIIRKIIRPVYACSHCNEPGEMAIAELPPRIIEGSNVGTGLLVEVLVNKYVYHLPLYRQEQIFRQRYGVEVSRQSMARWVEKCAQILEHLYLSMKALLLSGNYLQIDETPVDVILEEKNGKTKKAYLWVYSQPGGNILFDFHCSRATTCLSGFIDGNFEGVIQCDGYAAYKTYEKLNAGVSLAHCWAHARRKFKEALDEETDKAAWMISKLQRLYRVEKRAREELLDPLAREALRQHEAIPILNTIEIFLHREQHSNPLPKSAWGKAIAYTLNCWDGLCLYAQAGYGHLEIDNNQVENGIRPTALGRKNWLFIGHPDAGWRSAVIYSIVASCKRARIDPYAYLFDVLPRIMDYPSRRIYELLPQNWKSTKEQAQSEVLSI